MQNFLKKTPNINDIETTTWQEAYNQHMSFFQDQQSYSVVNENFEQLILGRTFYPRPFVSSPIQHVISLPWATEYFVLPYWFFFFSLGLVSIWLITLYVQTTLHIESRLLRRETRGFSRAQTGDALTSVVPLAWSISMLMHASVHSFNFDDNTAGTVFSFNVLAYQWGWNYYFPSDLIKLFKDGPKRVGHSSIDNFSTNQPYSTLLTRFRTEYIKKITMQGSFVNRNFALLSPLSFYIQSSNSDVNFEPVVFFFLQEKNNDIKGFDLLQDYSTDLLIKTEQTNSQYYNAYSWILSSPSSKVLANYFVESSSNFLKKYNSLIGYENFFSLATSSLYVNNTSFLEKNNFFDLYPYSNIQLSPFRSPASLSLVGNRFFLIHKHFSSNPLSNLYLGFNSLQILNKNLTNLIDTPSFLNLNFLPLGFFNTQPNKPIINFDNIVSSSIKPDYTGFGLLNTEDFGFTNSAASSLSVSLSINSILFNSLSDNKVYNFFPNSKYINNNHLFNFFTDFINDWSSSFLLSIFSQFWVLSATNLMNSSKLNLFNSSVVFFYQSIFNNFTSYFFNFFCTSQLHSTLSWLDLSFMKNYVRGVEYNNIGLQKVKNTFLLNQVKVSFFLWDDFNFITNSNWNLQTHPSTVAILFLSNFNCLSTNNNIFNSFFNDLVSKKILTSTYFFFNNYFNLNNSLLVSLNASSLDQISITSSNNYFNWFLNSTVALVPTNLNTFYFNVTRSFSSKLLNGLDFSKPAKNFSSFMDPFDFSNGSVSLHFAPLVNFTELFNWSIAWINLATISNSPSYKLWRGGYVRRPLSNELSSYFSLFSHKQTYLKNAQLSKINLFSETPKLKLYNNTYSFVEETAAVLDKEWAVYNIYTLLDVPTPFEDLDPLFIHKRWTTDINATRRTDHSARYLVGSGPILSAQKNKKLNYFSNFWFSSIGPQGYKNLSPKDALISSTGSLFYNYPSYKLANIQFLLGSYFLKSSLTFNNNEFLSTHQGYPMLPFYKKSYTASNIIKSFSLNQKTFLFNFFSNICDFDLNLITFSSIWTFRPSIFSQTRVRNFGQNMSTTSELSLLALSLLSYNKNLNSFISFSSNFNQVNNHPLIHLLSQSQNNSTVFNRFFSYLSSNFIELGGLKKDIYTFIPADIRSIKRLRTSKAVCLPSDIPMHVVCGSKDVIHSWAIPGLGIKIDCIPGFSSHRRLTIRWRGTFWGQCMEVCGRYHHWMPILIHITHRDLFLSWCLSFLKALETRQVLSLQPVPMPAQLLTWVVSLELRSNNL